MTFLQGLLGCVVFYGAFAAILFGSAGRSDVPFFWAYIGVLMALMLAALRFPDKELLQERRKPGPGGKDLTLRRDAILVMVTHWAVAGADVGRWHFSDAVPHI